MNKIDFIRQEVPLEELWAQLGEEATELSHAVQKLRRIIAGRNPSPVPLEAAKAMVFEEIADVLLCLAVLRINLGHPVIRGTVERKLARWVRRLEAQK